MEPSQALTLIESSLRWLITSVLGAEWIDAVKPKELEEIRRRKTKDEQSGERPYQDRTLIDYTFTAQLFDVIDSRWESFQEALGNREFYSALAHFIISDRNPVAHNREVLPWERDLFTGAAGWLQHQVDVYRQSSRNGRDRYYSRIERIVDANGQEMKEVSPLIGLNFNMCGRSDIGARISFECAATPVRRLQLLWSLRIKAGFTSSWREVDQGVGSAVQLSYVFTERDVSEDAEAFITLRTDSKWTREKDSNYGEFDDIRRMRYSVSPPLDEEERREYLYACPTDGSRLYFTDDNRLRCEHCTTLYEPWDVNSGSDT